MYPDFTAIRRSDGCGVCHGFIVNNFMLSPEDALPEFGPCIPVCNVYWPDGPNNKGHSVRVPLIVIVYKE